MNPPPLSSSSPVSHQPRGDWWSRNWKWVVPLWAFLGAGSLAAFTLLILNAIKSCDAHASAVALARVDPAVVAALGHPVVEGFLTTGSVSLNGPSGKAEFSIPLNGPKGSGFLHVEATRKLGEWRFDALVLETEKPRRRIDFTPGESRQGTPPPPQDDARPRNPAI